MRKLLNLAIWVGVCAVVGSLQLSAFGAGAALPYTEKFESWSIASPWSTGGTGRVAVDAAHIEGSQGVIVSNDVLSLEVDGAPAEAWVQIYTKPFPAGADPVLAGDIVSAAFYLNTNGNLRAYVDTNGAPAGGDGWVTVASGVPLNQWLAFAVHITYLTTSWDLYYGTEGQYGKVMKLANWTGPLARPEASSNALYTVTVDSEMSANVDAVALAQGVQGVPTLLTGVSETNLIVQDFSGHFTGRQSYVVYDYTGGMQRLSGLLGAELAAGLKKAANWRNSDHIRLYTSSGDSEYAVSNGATWGANPSTFYGNTPLPSSVTLLPIDNIELLQTSGERTSGFFPYNVGAVGSGVGSLVVTGMLTVAAQGQSVLATLNGAASPAGGWTWFQWRGTAVGVNSAVFIDDDQVMTEMDKLYLLNPTTGSWKELVWDDTLKRWEFNNSAAGDIVAHNSYLWVLRQAGADSSISMTLP
jgi:hypothetical protein